MLPPSPDVLAAEVRLMLQGATDSNRDSIRRELCQLVDNGLDGCVLLLQVCLDEVLLNAGEEKNFQWKHDLLSAIFRYCLDKTYFCTCFCEAVMMITSTDGLLETLSSVLELSTAEKVGIGLALSDSQNSVMKQKGQQFAIAQIEELCLNPIQSVSNDQIHEIVVFLQQTDGLSKHMDTFSSITSLLEVGQSPFFAPIPKKQRDIQSTNPSRHLDLYFNSTSADFESLLSEIGKEISMADTVTELGYGCTVDIAHCMEMLSAFEPLDNVAISKLLGAVIGNHNSLGEAQNSTHATFVSAIRNSPTSNSPQLTTWNTDVLVDSINAVAPSTNWVQVMENLDHGGFSIPDEAGFYLLMSIYARACKDRFPLHAVCGSMWTNTDGQISFLKHAVSAPATMFTFAHSSRLLALPEFASLSPGNSAWFCLDLLEVLCQLAEVGHTKPVREMLEYPLEHCPELLLVGLGHINTAYNLLQFEVLSCVFPAILKDAAKSNVVNSLWHINTCLTLRGFVDAHSDPSCLLRIVDVCQDMKILSAVLGSTPFAFSIKLAAAASWKDHNHLEKWLTEKLIIYKDSFLKECVNFLKETMSAASYVVEGTMEQPQVSVINKYLEACHPFMKVLQSHLGLLLSNHLSDELRELYTLYESRNHGSVVRDTPTSEGGSDDVEVEANAYFQQMFSGQISIDSMIQMLARFKESPEKREQLIFNCMITNLFEEYKFLTKYPDKQLKLAAVLFGSLIKHQLVAHLGLGIALRAVLDALRKSLDSKMFLFGTIALEQFMDRVVEWPQYCNHILQISHLRENHADMVYAIERALASISSGQNEPNVGNLLSAEQHVSGSSSMETMEVSEPSWQFMGTSPTQLGRTLSSFPLQQRQPEPGVLGDRSMVSMGTSQNNSTLPSQPPVPLTPADSTIDLKATALAHSTNMATTGFLRPRSTPTGLPRQHSYVTGFGAALNIETLVAAAEQRDRPIETPPSEVQDKILFMINNISTSNLEAKANEFNQVLQEQYYPWFAQYMVMKRASIEPNFHELYLKFFAKLNSRSLSKEMLKATYENCKVLLRSDLIKSSSEERSLLKNLGSWLGKFTIGRNQTLRAKEIDPKSLIVEAYEKGLMIAVIPFTSKILEPCQSSIVYRPPNPWTMGILSLLAEIYNLPNLKMNLKFDIEVLFKNLSVDMKDVKPTSLLRDREREVEGNPDFSNKDVASQIPVAAEVSSGIIPPMNHAELQPQYTAPVRLPPNSMAEDDKIASLMPEQVPLHTFTQTPLASLSPSPLSLSQLLSLIPHEEIHFKINTKLGSLGSQLQFSKIIGVALDKAIKEIILPVIERSVTTASKTTKELVLKDYATKSDINSANRSGRLMVGTLAGSLAHVTCKEPLRVALSSHLRSLIQNLTSNSETVDQVTDILINDNLDLGCAIIESVATRQAVDLIDGEITQSFSQQRRKRDAAGPAYYDSFIYAQVPFAPVPEVLRTKPESAAQQRVYEEFVHVWQRRSQSIGAAGSSSASTAAVSSNFGVPRAYSPNSAPATSSTILTSQTAHLTLTQPTELVSEELIPGAAQLSSDSPSQIGTSDSSGWLGGTIASASTSPPPVTSNDLPVGGTTVTADDLSAMMFPPSTISVDNFGLVLPDPLNTDDALKRYRLISQKLEALIAKDGKDSEIQSVIAEVPDLLVKCVSPDEAALAVAQKVFKSLYDNTSNSGRVMWFVATLVAIRDVCKLVVKELTNWVIFSDDEKKFNIEIIIALIRSDLLSLGEYNDYLARLIDGGRNRIATEFAMSLVQKLISQNSVCISELFSVVDALSKISRRPGSPESLQQLIEKSRHKANTAPTFDFGMDEKVRQPKDKKVLSSQTNKEENSVNDITLAESVTFHDQVAHLYTEWCQVCDHPSACDAAYSHFVMQLEHMGLLKGDESTERFIRILTELAVTRSLVSEQIVAPGGLSQQSSQQPHISYFPIDSYSKLVSMVLKHSSVEMGPNEGSLLPKILSVTVKIIQKDAEEKKSLFNPRPFFRLFINWLNDLSSSDPHHDGANFQVLTAFANAFHLLQPLRIPSLSFAWLELVSHRTFMPRLLMCNSQKGWPFFQRLLVDMFKFMEPYLRNADLLEPVRLLYKGTMRVLLVLLHDFPEFLCDYHFSFCDVIPTSCIQMRNVILSAYPHSMRLPDPSTPNLKIDLLAEISIAPRIMSDIGGALKLKHMKTDVDEYLKRPEGSSFLSDIKQKLLLPQNEAIVAGTCYNVPLINSLVLYVGIQAVQLQENKVNALATTPMDIFQIATATEIFRNLATNLDTEGRYLLLNSIANQLRYPNNHTHYFSFIVLYLFAEATQDKIQEQITRILLERLIVKRPHPWGLLITFTELVKNPRYNFWNRSFTHSAPDIQKLFEAAAKSCAAKAAVEGVPDVNRSTMA
ncbi:CCR4-NOT transcription complex subunit 1 isoform X3 [Brachypodium distachyon]|uniref:CCR4-NOT transcription complex subunit 1 isoform X3 n=1 Tax=Brachypodium distachyon TaxID=15368 RepID=UPI00071D92D7|nr:CCR4-NOT transcription complex subunit 1 isoform X3 [Brachypodium distachyon]|eukprot:XP_014752689.1 CCR4-NOT transcription complex subunit 1 isoform X3 [Brachypodium distachyon]